MSHPVDFDKALKARQPGQALTGNNSLTQAVNRTALPAELDFHMALNVEANRKNSFGKISTADMSFAGPSRALKKACLMCLPWAKGSD